VLFARLAAAQMVETKVGDDAVDPGVERALEAEVPEMAIRLQERFLVDVLRVGLRTGEVQRQAQDRVVVLADECLERGAVTALRRADQIAVFYATQGTCHFRPGWSCYLPWPQARQA